MSEANSQTEKLLNDVAGLLKAREIVYRVTGENFNIFRILNVEEKEHFICEVLAELLSPSGSHYQGSLFLKPFVKDVLVLNIPDAEIDRARVYREYYTYQGRRIDIVIETANYFIAIEVKINAGDLNGQCMDYYEEAKQHCFDESNAKIIYLTPDGREPSPESSCGKKVCCISFRKNIHEWLSSCLNFKEIEHAVSVSEIMRQFMMTIENFTGCAQEGNMEVKKLILKSPENLRAAFELQKSVNEAVEDMRKRFLVAVNEKLKSWNITHGTVKDEQGNDLPRDHAVHYEYDKMPGVVVCLGSSIYDTYVSYYVTGDDKTDIEAFVRKFEMSRRKKSKSGSHEGNFLYWEFCCTGGKEFPNLYGPNPNNATFELCDPETFRVFVDDCAEKIKVFLEFPPE